MSIDIKDLGPDAQRQIRAQMREQAVQKASKAKYNNRTAFRGKIRFDSQKEARRYDELMLYSQAGKIRDLRLQPEWTLQEAYVTPEGVRVRAIRYRADFSYEIMRPYWKGYEQQCPDEGWLLVVEDVKSSATKTRVYEIKRKLLQEKYGITVEEV